MQECYDIRSYQNILNKFLIYSPFMGYPFDKDYFQILMVPFIKLLIFFQELRIISYFQQHFTLSWQFQMRFYFSIHIFAGFALVFLDNCLSQSKETSIQKYIIQSQILSRNIYSFYLIYYICKFNIQHNKEANVKMQDDSFLTPMRTITCFIHKKQKATHICTDLQCLNNPLICQLCINDSKTRNSHSSHQQLVKPVNDALQVMAALIKNNIKPVQTLYQKTIGHRDNQLIRTNLEKLEFIGQEIENRLQSIKIQVDLQMELLVKQFQKQILLEKQDFSRRIEDYKKKFFSNLQVLKRQSIDIINFQNSLKFYSNSNTLLLKLSIQAQKKSLDWFIQQKKILAKISSITQSSYSASSSLNIYINKANQMNMMIKPVWIGQKNQLQDDKDLKQLVKNTISKWVSLPELSDLDRSNSYYSNSTNQQYKSYSNPGYMNNYQLNSL